MSVDKQFVLDKDEASDFLQDIIDAIKMRMRSGLKARTGRSHSQQATKFL